MEENKFETEESRAKIELLIINWIDEILTMYYSENMKKKMIYEVLKAFVDNSVKENLISSTEEKIALDIIEERYKFN